MAVPLGVQPVRAARARGFVMSLATIFGYYVLLSFGQALAEQAVIPAAVGLWLPNLVFALLGAWLFAQAARERTMEGLERLQSRLGLVRARLLGRLGSEAAP